MVPLAVLVELIDDVGEVAVVGVVVENKAGAVELKSGPVDVVLGTTGAAAGAGAHYC